MDDKELARIARILKSTVDDLMLDYYIKCADLLGKLGIWSELEGKEGVPLGIRWFTRRLLDLAINCLPEDQRERFTEEWASHINEVPGDVGKIAFASGQKR